MLPPAQVTHLAEVLRACAAFAAGLPHSRAGGFVYEQEKLLSAIYNAREKQLTEENAAVYPIAYEKKLQALIGSRDKTGTRELLNELLGHIYCSCDFDLDAIKARVVELVVVLSRATIDAGADMQEIFLFNNNYFHEIEQFQSLEELSVWLTGIMHRFISYSFDFTQVKHSDVVYKVMEYVKANFHRKISLDDVARTVYLSRSYLSSIFKEETGQSLFSYINKVRVEKASCICGTAAWPWWMWPPVRLRGSELFHQGFQEGNGDVAEKIPGQKIVPKAEIFFYICIRRADTMKTNQADMEEYR